MLTGLPPVIGTRPRILVLGSFPSLMSLEKREYYANPRNQFWDIIEEILGIPKTAPYDQRLESLDKYGVALWDVVNSCERPGSMDGNIRNVSLNDIPRFVEEHCTIRNVIANGRAAGNFLASCQLDRRKILYQVLPSTSPANARLKVVEKVNAWKIIEVRPE